MGPTAEDIPELESHLAENSDDPDLLDALSVAHRDAGNLDTALDFSRKALALSRAPSALHNFALVIDQLPSASRPVNLITEAIDAIEEALAKVDDTEFDDEVPEEARQDWIRKNRGLRLALLGKLFFLRSISSQPPSEADFEAGAKKSEEALEVLPDDEPRDRGKVYSNLATAYQGRYTVRKEKPDSESMLRYRRLALDVLELGSKPWRTAVQDLQEAYRILNRESDASDLDAWLQQSYPLAESGRRVQAAINSGDMPKILTAIDEEETIAWEHEFRDAADHQENMTTRIFRLEQAIEKAKAANVRPADKGKLLWTLGNVHWEWFNELGSLGHLSPAIKLAEEAADCDPDSDNLSIHLDAVSRALEGMGALRSNEDNDDSDLEEQMWMVNAAINRGEKVKLLAEEKADLEALLAAYDRIATGLGYRYDTVKEKNKDDIVRAEELGVMAVGLEDDEEAKRMLGSKVRKYRKLLVEAGLRDEVGSEFEGYDEGKDGNEKQQNGVE